jgi:chorismate mutase
MKELYDLCAELYESLADKNDEESKEVIKKINSVLRDIQKSKDE